MSSIVDDPTLGTIGTARKPKRYDIELYQGDTFSFSLVLKNGGTPINVTGWTAQAQIKKSSDNTPGETPSLSVVVGTSDGKFTISLTDTGTAALQGATEYKYDVQLSDGTEKRTFIGGTIKVTEDITEWV
jgi:hypothetical protein